MTGPEHPEAVQPALVAAPPPASTPQPSPTNRPRTLRVRTAEVVLAGLVLIFAFLAASFVARNADFWLHLASGRLLARGAYSFGSDPFAYTTAGVSWVNHAWLFDRIVYLLYREKADAWLVVLKAAMIAGLATLMLSIRRPGQPGWTPAFCTALAILAMSPGLLLQPRCLSAALLGLTLWLLWRGRAPASASAWKLRLFGRVMDARVLLIPLCALWVNFDDWFLLGPLLVGLFWVGDRMQPADQRPRGMRPTPAWLLPACLAACLCSPYTLWGFTLPADLYPLPFSGGLLQDVRFRRLSSSPWTFDAPLFSSAGPNFAGLAYFLLVALGVASFAVNRSALRDWRVLVWVVFGLLGAWSVRLVPFFAVVGGPVAALNFQGMKYEVRPAVVTGLRAACLLVLVGLIALAVPGWLHGFNQKAAQVAWGVEINPSLRRAAETLHRWRHDGKLVEAERSFCFHPDAACYCAWFCPDEKSFLDPRLSLFTGAADDYVAVCRGLEPSLASGAVPLGANGGDWRTVLRDHGVAVVVLYVPEPASVLSVLGPLYDNPAEWTLLSVDGQAAIIGWNPARDDRFAALRFDPGRLVFGQADDEAPAVPGRGPGRDPREPDWMSRLGRPPVAPWESTAAGVDLVLFQDPREPGRREAAVRAAAEQEAAAQHYYHAVLGLTHLPLGRGAPAGPLGDMTPIILRVAALQMLRPQFPPPPPEAPPDLAMLAVRMARRAVAADPDDANAYLQLALAYLNLRDGTPERSHAASLTPLAMLRHVQIVTALRQALILNPDQEAAHQLLADLFLDMRPVPYYDLALDHRRAQLQLARRFGRASNEDAEAFQGRIDALETQVLGLEKVVQDSRDVCEIRFRSVGDDPVARSRIALELGLAGKALDDVLMKARVEVAGSALAQRELELLVLTGRTREAREMLDDEQMRANKHKLLTYEVSFGEIASGVGYEFPTYEWLLGCASAAVGDYDTAAAALDMIGDWLAARQAAGPVAYAGSVGADIGAPAGAPAGPLALAWLTERMLHTRGLYEEGDRNGTAERAGVLTLEAMLDLERGAPESAGPRLKASIDLSRSLKDFGDPPGGALAREYLKRCAAGR